MKFITSWFKPKPSPVAPVVPVSFDYDDAYVQIAIAADNFKTLSEFRCVVNAIAAFRKTYSGAYGALNVQRDVNKLSAISFRREAKIFSTPAFAGLAY